MINKSEVKVGKVLDTIGSLHESLTPSAKRIAIFVLKNPSIVIKLSIADLSTSIKVGEATIIRFCRTLGFSGFQAFKLSLAIELSKEDKSKIDILDTNVMPNDSAKLIAQKLHTSINNVLAETLNLLNFETLNTVTQLIKSAKGIYFFGVGSSGITAEDAKNKLMRIGINVDALTNNHFMYMKASLLNSDYLAIGISHSGQSKETIKAIKIAKKTGATTIVLTHNPRSSITQFADYVLVNGNRQGKLQGDSIGTKISQLYVLDLIYALLVQNDLIGAQENKVKTTNALK